MNRYRNHLVAVAFLSLVAVAPARAASLTQVGRSTWAGSVTLPSYVQMYIYVPDKLATNPPIVVSSHSCGSTATGQMGNMPKTKAAADKNGFIMILPDNPGQNCWDAGSKQSMTHDGGGDTHAVAQMVRYTLTKYSGDPKRVYALGGSSGAMMTQALLGVYPEMFMAGAARAGVPCGCWAESYAASNQWSGPCAGGSVDKTPQAWGDYVRAINPSYTGHRPRVQLYQGESDETISYKNMGESVDEWTNVLGLSLTPTSTDTITSSGYSYDRRFWKNTCGFTVLESWSAPGQKHSMTYEEDAILKFFGLDVAGGSDPEQAACSSTGGAGGAGGGGGSGGTGGSRDGGLGGRDGGEDAALPGTGGARSIGGAGTAGSAPAGGSSGGGGVQGSGGRLGTGGALVTGGGPAAGSAGNGGTVQSSESSNSGGTLAKGGTSGDGSTLGTGGVGGGGTSATVGTGGQSVAGAQSSSAAAGEAGRSGNSGSTAGRSKTSSGGCSYAVASPAEPSAGLLAALLFTGMGLAFRRRPGS